jgi:hypothetical protein
MYILCDTKPQAELSNARLVAVFERTPGMEETEGAPEIYFDAIEVTVSLLSVNMTFSLSPMHPPRPGTVAGGKPLMHARTSHKHAKMIAMLLTRQLKKYEEDTGDIISLPPEVYRALGLDPNNW